MSSKKQDNFSLYSKYDILGLILLGIGGVGYIYDVSPTLTHWFYADFEHLDQPQLLPNYFAYPIFITGGVGLFLTLRMFSNSECF